MKWGIIGTGGIARKFATTVNQMEAEGESFVGVASRTLPSAEAFQMEFAAKRAYGTYESMMADPDIDAVYIATPNIFHYENAVMCLLAGKHVLCEKPFTINAKQSRALFALARDKKLFIMEAFWIRFMPVLQEMQKIIAAGEIGDVRHVRSGFGFIPGESLNERKRTINLAAGALLDIGIYNLGFVHMVMDAAPVSMSSSVVKNEYGTDDFSAVLLEYPGEKSASIITAIGLDIPRNASVFGTQGEITFPDFQQAQRMTIRRFNGETREVAVPFDMNGFEYQIREVNRCTKLGMNTSDVLRESDSVTVMEIMDALRATWGIRYPGEE